MPNLALFDFDNTLTTRDTFISFFAFAVPKWRFYLGNVFLTPYLLAYKAKLVNGNGLRSAVLRIGLTGLDQRTVELCAEKFAEQVLTKLERSGAIARLQWHQARGDRVIVVSGGLDLYLKPWCQKRNLELLCSSAEVCDSRFTGNYSTPQCVAEEKVHRINRLLTLADYDQIYAYGDSPDDHAMLALAHVPVYRWQLQHVQ